ncbi:MAG: precorrin-4 C(11)-methyltransferase [Veillonellaceae bacterium]|nr:precorrin-4 C(11)-methyltransferase [Veillonellaceae bacterium]
MNQTQVYFVGAGPGDPELITVKGRRLLSEADVVIYAGSLVNPALLAETREACEIHNSASMTLQEVIGVMRKAVADGKRVVRLHTGDPSIYGAIQEQIDCLNQVGIRWEVIPGVSSFLAAAAALGQEYTLPGISQTVIITRMEGRTPVPDREKIRSLAEHQATMCIFLSVHMFDDLVRDLTAGGYPPDTPVAVVEKASWPEQRIFRGTLTTIADQLAAAGVNRTAMVIIGKVLDGEYERSRLYAPEFGHMFREAKS